MENRLSEIQNSLERAPARAGSVPVCISSRLRRSGDSASGPHALRGRSGPRSPRGETHLRGGPLSGFGTKPASRGSRSRLGEDLSIRRSLVDSRASDAALMTRNCWVGLWCLPTLGEERSGRGSAGRSGRLGAEVGEPPQSGSKDCRYGLIARPRGFRRGKVRSRDAAPLHHRLIGDRVVVASLWSGDVPRVGFRLPAAEVAVEGEVVLRFFSWVRAAPPGSGTAHHFSPFTRGAADRKVHPAGVLRTALTAILCSPRVFAFRDKRTQTQKETPHD